MKRKKMPEPYRLAVGEKVRFRFGTVDVVGVVKEDRGPIGVGSRHLYGIEFDPDPTHGPPLYVELPAVEMEKVTETAAPAT